VPKRIEGVTRRVLECAKKEFLEKGFQGTSIRTIAEKAGTSPRAIYTRFPDKQGLFSAIVEPVISEFKEMLRGIFEANWKNPNSSLLSPESLNTDHEGYPDIVDYIYDHIEVFTMVIEGSVGTRYACFVEELVEINDSYVRESSATDRIKAAGIRMARGEIGGVAMAKLYHLLSHSFYTGFFEIISQGMNRNDAKFFVRKLTEFYDYGFLGILS